MLKSNNILILAPHTDDGELGCGASIAKYITEGKQITYVAFSTCSASLPPDLPADTLEIECRQAVEALGIRDLRFFDFEVRRLSDHRQQILHELVQMNRQLKPQTVFLPSQGDVHQDHQVIYSEGLRAFKNCNVLGYELPWNNTRFQPVYFETISPKNLEQKLTALSRYASQKHRRYMNAKFISSLARVRGVQAETEFAEAFEIYRMIS